MVAEPTTAPSRQQFRFSGLSLAITEHAPMPMAMVEGASHVVRSVNAAFCRLMDKPMEQIVGKPFNELLPKQDECRRLLDRVFQTGESETYLEEEYPNLRPVFWSYLAWPVWEQERLVGVVIQVTETAQLHDRTLAINEALVLGSVRQHELTEAAESLNAQLEVEMIERQKTARELAEMARLLDLSNDAIMVMDLGCRILYWNHGAEELYGWPGEEALGKVSHALLQTKYPTPVAQITEELYRTGRWAGELVQTKRGGELITVLARRALERDSHGNPAAILEHMTDITERMKAVEALRQAQAQLTDRAGQLEELVAARTAELTATNKQLEAFVYSIAHDLRAPLRAMEGFADMLVEDAGAALNKTSQDCAAHIKKSAQFMDALLRDLLAFSRISQQGVELASINLQTVVESVLARLQKDILAKHARVESSGPWPDVLAHEPTLAQVLFNLASNALKFVKPDVPPLLRLRADATGEFIRVWVEDDGPGIEPDHQVQIFRPFTRLYGEKFAGTGIGLAIVQKGVERMGGRVGVESAPGQGSHFWFELRKA